MRAWATSALLLVVAGSATASTPFRVALVPTKSQEGGQIIEAAAKNPRTFYVVVTNDSPDPQLVWETWSSWGYRTISFDVTLQDGSTRHVSRKEEAFTRNFPSTFSIATAGYQVYPIQLDSAWANLPVFRGKGEVKVTVEAIYEVQPSPEADQHCVWVGRVVSERYVLTLRHW